MIAPHQGPQGNMWSISTFLSGRSNANHVNSTIYFDL